MQAIRLTATLMILLMGRPTGVAQERGRDAASGTPAAATARPSKALVDINHASVQELMTVPGMTLSWASRIVRFRPYYSKQDLLDAGVVNSQVYERIKGSIIAHRDKP